MTNYIAGVKQNSGLIYPVWGLGDSTEAALADAVENIDFAKCWPRLGVWECSDEIADAVDVFGGDITVTTGENSHIVSELVGIGNYS